VAADDCAKDFVEDVQWGLELKSLEVQKDTDQFLNRSSAIVGRTVMTLRIYLVIIAACTIGTAAAQTAMPTSSASSRAVAQWAVQVPSATVTFSSAPIDARVILGETYVHGSINGSRTLDVVLDSAASVSIVAPRLADELHLKTGETRVAAGPGNGGDNLLHMVQDVTLKLGATMLTRQTIAALPIDYVAQRIGVPTEGIFGGNFFSRMVIDEDYAAHAVRLIDPATFTLPAGFVSIPVNVAGWVAFTQLTLKAPDGSRVSGTFLIDSGLVGDLVFTEPFVRAHPELLSGKRVDAPSIPAVGGAVQLQVGRIPTLTLGPFVLKEPVAAFPSNASGVLANEEVAGILGNGVLRRFHVIFDWPNGRILLAPGPDVNLPFPANCSGLSLEVAPPIYHRLRVNAVIADSPAAQAGILAGDVIEAVARGTGKLHPDVGLELASVRTELEEPGKTFLVLIERNGKPMQLTIVTRELY
jgi:hypothetical protein